MCLKYAPNQMEAEDNLQDAFITIFQRIGQYQGKGSFEGWMKRIAINTVQEENRQQNRAEKDEIEKKEKK